MNVRARSTAGTWGSVQTVVFTLSPMFNDGFEGATLVPPWAQVVQSGATATRSTAAAMTGSYGLTVGAVGTLLNTSRAYVATPAATAVPMYRAQFQLNPGTLITGTRWVTVFQGRSGAAQQVRVEYQRNGTGTPLLRMVVTRTGGTTTSATATLNVGTANTVRLDWASAGSATVTLTVNGTPVVLSGLNTSGRTITTGWLGLSAAPTTGTGTYSGTANVDAFASARYPF